MIALEKCMPSCVNECQAKILPHSAMERLSEINEYRLRATKRQADYENMKCGLYLEGICTKGAYCF